MDESEAPFGTGLLGLVGRSLVFVFAVGLAVFLFWAFVNSWSLPPEKATGERILQLLLADALLVMATFCALMALFLLFPKEWLATLVKKRAMRTLYWGVGVALLVVAATLVVFLCEP